MGGTLSLYGDWGDEAEQNENGVSNNNNNSNSNSHTVNSINRNGSNITTLNNSNNKNLNSNNNRKNINPSSDLHREDDEERRKYLNSIRELESKFKLTQQEAHKLRSHKSAITIQKFWKGYTQRKKWSLFLTKSQVIKELLITERDYVKFLNIIVNVYMVPLKELSQKTSGGTLSKETSRIIKNIKNEGGQSLLLNLDQPPLSQEEVKIVFSQIEVILLYNSMLLEKLSSRIYNDSWSYHQRIGDIFLEMIHFLKVPYRHYITNFTQCLKVLEAASKRPSYVLFIQECKSLTEVARRDLQSFVSMPIQRIPRYVLLLRELIKFTHKSDPDYHNIQQALHSMETIADIINKQMREEEISREMIAINDKLTPKIKNLIEPHRRLIKEGEVKVYKADGNDHDIATGTIRPSSIWKIQSPRFRYIYLFNDSFVLSKKNKTLYKVEKYVNLEYSTVIDRSKSIKVVESADSHDDLDNGSDTCNIENSDTESGSKKNTANSISIPKSTSNGTLTSPDRKLSISSLIESIGSGRESVKAQSEGDRYYFKLHTLECTLVICLPNEEEKEQWRNAFVNVINQVTENTLSFNPKWSTNQLISGIDAKDSSISSVISSFTSPSLNRLSPYHSKLSSPMRGTLLTVDNFSIKESINELLALNKPIKGMENTDSNNTFDAKSPSLTKSDSDDLISLDNSG
ncbi:hypothetical protein DICPUDRAFT_152605 [Dictyostelium purpureum]|uniref:DH domain-containing protein n=1 Tax=Dictyostelium purpureum TaxID=5786 RepID=F0ZLT9_DICPU|nr:uncharacterized protein DICPUDRAFT_152605 [Dictyostelium purpureum]EGC35087.1 hypothetical protein DICPUDRAFT_152605 [Dictyostelium purpureum]|eukprot:XP_003288394.1 hypothetical protein DICPUDRAFT_152605 [Dictyostelium purpureum]